MSNQNLAPTHATASKGGSLHPFTIETVPLTFTSPRLDGSNGTRLTHRNRGACNKFHEAPANMMSMQVTPKTKSACPKRGAIRDPEQHRPFFKSSSFPLCAAWSSVAAASCRKVSGSWRHGHMAPWREILGLGW